MSTTAVSEEKLASLPVEPGVYILKDAKGKPLYVGKAKSLRDRVRSYFREPAGSHHKPPEMIRRIADFETIVTDSTSEALILESNLIKEYAPRFNIRLRDDKTYPYIKVTVGEPFPRVFVTRRLVKDGSRYFGPYADVGHMRRALRAIKKLYTIRSCHYDLPQQAPSRPCLDYYIGRCKAPCVGYQTESDYREMIDEVLLVLQGHTGKLAEKLAERMEDAAQSLEFERAAEYRDVLRGLAELERRQLAIDPRGGDVDAVALVRDGDSACGVIFKIREGKLLGREAHFLGNVENEAEESILSVFLARYYLLQQEVARELLVPIEFEDRQAVEAHLRERTGRAFSVHVPQRGFKRELVRLAAENARHLLEERQLLEGQAERRAPPALYSLRGELNLERVPRAIVGFDISNIQGADAVGASVWFENGEPLKSEYRRYRIESVEGVDDYAAMQEIVSRYFSRRLAEEKRLPDLVLIDGGKGQLSAAAQALERVGLPDLPVVALAKREELIFTLDRIEPLRLTRRAPGLRLLQRVRDEVHRFGLQYHRQRRSRRTLRSGLLDIPGVGPARQESLLREFGSLKAVKAAAPEEIARVPGIGEALAGKIAAALQEPDDATG
ncbi:MAG: excinuclease ABC subunit UvrC [Gemmatimonadetes bacterium]|uniref:UvrABC system protein C n=1 Tax=Candidatus Kutchimonas denitrificans TaxID=3056748 RepID=A0AAE5CC64_9BACT|nr:excinuclease ABC subunit UvrC [Gemmatimonadota bacterium]NIR75270.1 excinuclease ABC subunit UvrC [Candidatus Kutchimonas denitrificans]NIS00208.1 excinuclease ABC subunit UvrC [Gemmatimonadota bacterium]NIT65800.1 excinuclease ABC subunit UvrC [Gemmatimonadota bacterium]NIU53078.1 excinuclease ABC subunit UvrC [Gemmatimonadota bacterium]